MFRIMERFGALGLLIDLLRKVASASELNMVNSASSLVGLTDLVEAVLNSSNRLWSSSTTTSSQNSLGNAAPGQPTLLGLDYFRPDHLTPSDALLSHVVVCFRIIEIHAMAVNVHDHLSDRFDGIVEL